jgi:hypothetical protein
MSSSGASSGASSANLNSLTKAALQNGVVNSGDLAQTALGITAGTGALAFTLAAASPCYVLSASGVLTPVTVTAGAQSVTPASLPASPNYAVIGIEMTTAGAFTSVKGTDTATQLNTGSLIASHTPAVTSGNLRIIDFAVQNNAGSFRFGDQTTVASQGVNWIDRRPWARGAFWLAGPVIVGADYTITSGTSTAIDTTNLRARIECSGVPLRIRLHGIAFSGTNNGFTDFAVQQDGTAIANTRVNTGGGVNGISTSPSLFEGETTPTAGSHLFAFFWDSGGANTSTLRATAAATAGPTATIEELFAQNSANGTA